MDIDGNIERVIQEFSLFGRRFDTDSKPRISIKVKSTFPFILSSAMQANYPIY
jgi:hypothetical protein